MQIITTLLMPCQAGNLLRLQAVQFHSFNITRYGFHGDDGNIFVCGNIVARVASWHRGDSIGCGLKNVIADTATIFWTRNGEQVYQIQASEVSGLYPTIALSSEGEQISLVLYSYAFKFV